MSIQNLFVPNGYNLFCNNLTTSGSQVTLFSATSGIQMYHWNVSTSNNTATPVLTLPLVSNSASTIESTCQAFVTAGTHINGALSRRTTTLLNNVAGTVTAVGNLENLSSNTAGLNPSVLTQVASGSNCIINVTGQVGDTVSWSGTTTVYN